MATSIEAEHEITIELPVRQCQRLFTPAGEELWIDGWRPVYLQPGDGRTSAGMVFLTTSHDEQTVWFMAEWSQDPYRARYLRVSPECRWGSVDVECLPVGETSTQVRVRFAMHALGHAGELLLRDLEPAPFAAMIEHWKERIDERLDVLRDAVIP